MTGGTVDKDDVTLSQLGLRAPGGFQTGCIKPV